MHRPSVDLPDPDSPTRPTLSFGPISMLTPRSAFHRALPTSLEHLVDITDGEQRIRASGGFHKWLRRCDRRGAPRGSHLGPNLLEADTGRESPRSDFAERWLCRPATIVCPPASRSERAHRRHVRGHRDGSLDRREVRLTPRRGWLGEHEAERIGVHRLLGKRGGRCRLDDGSRVQDVDPLAHAERDPQIVGDENEAHPSVRLDLGQQPEDLRLGGHVQRRRGLVGDEQLRVPGQRRCERHTLTHAARQLERVPPTGFGAREADLLEPPLGFDASLASREFPLAGTQHLFDVELCPQHGIEHGEGILEEHRDAAAADSPELPFAIA